MFPQLFHIGRFFLPTYGVLVSLGVLVGLWVSVRNARKQGINPDDAWNFGILVVLCGIVGAKILYIINDWSYYAAHPGDIEALAQRLRESAGGAVRFASSWRSFFRTPGGRAGGGGLVHPQASYGAPGYV